MTPRFTAGERRAGHALLPGLLLVALGATLVARGAASPSTRGSEARHPLGDAPRLVGGVDVGETDLARLASAMRAQGLTTLQVSHEATLGQWDRATLDAREGVPGALRARVRAARRAGLEVMLVLRVRLDSREPRNRHLWHGLIWPKASELRPFFAQYRAFVLEAARLAEEEGVAMLVIGNELNALTSTAVDVPGVLARALDPAQLEREAAALNACESEGPVRWHDGGTYRDLRSAVRGEQRALRAWASAVAGGEAGRSARLRERRRQHEDAFRAILDEARASYGGLLSYGAGFDAYADVGFWDATDALVTTAYFGLRHTDEETRPPTLERAWERHLRAIERVARATARRPALPVYFGELGFTRRAGSSVRPWSYEGFELLPRVDGSSACIDWSGTRLDPGERVRALDALASVLDSGALPNLRGFSLWKLTLMDEHWDLEPYAIRLRSHDEVARASRAEQRAWEDSATLDALGRLEAALPHADAR